MKTLFFTSLLMISTVIFSQSKKEQIISPNKPSKAVFVKLGDIKGESTTNQHKKRTIKIGGTEKPYARVSNTNNRRRVELLKSNKQGDPNKPNKQ